jgi:hypothetical protein
MTINFKRYINKTILVSIPNLFHDAKCHPFKLLGVELPGVWLQSDELTTRLLPEQMTQYAAAGPAVFVPFAHIAGILVPTTQPAAAAPTPATITPATATPETTTTTTPTAASPSADTAAPETAADSAARPATRARTPTFRAKSS